MTRTNELPRTPAEALASLLDSSPYPLAVCGPDGVVAQAGQALCARAGLSADQCAGQTLQTVLPEQEAPQLLGQLSPEQWLYGWLRPVAAGDAAAELAGLENRVFLLALEQIGLYVFTYRIDRDELRVLAPVLPIFPQGQTWKGGPEVISNYIHSSEEDALFLADAFASAAFGRSTTLDLRSKATGEEHWVRLTLSPILHESRMTGTLVGTVLNITDQKLAEQSVTRNTAFHNNALTGISSGWELDLNGNSWSHLWNGEPVLSFLSVPQLHYNDYDTYFTQTLHPLIHPDDWASYADVMERGALLARFRRGSHTCSVEYRIRSRPADSTPYEWRNVTVRLSRDPISLRPKASCHVTDISPQKANELEAQREKRDMELTAREERRANARKSQYLADMSRTLLPPLKAMVGVSELALMEQMSDLAREYLQQIHDFGNDLAQMLGTVLAQANTQQGIPTEEEYSPWELLTGLKTLAESRVENVSLALQLEGQVPARLYGDQMRLQQALLNLALSAMQMVPQVELSMSCTPEDDEHTLARFTITDRSSVLSDSQLENVFIAFAQLGSRYGGGTGLGMSLARQMVRLMDGQLWAESLPEGGVRFVLTIPQRVIDPRPLEMP